MTAGEDAVALQGAAPSLRVRIIDATVRCIARWGVAKTTLDDVAREAGCSRATVYRAFPGGKDAVLTETAQHEVLGFVAEVVAEAARGSTLEETTVAAVHGAARRMHESEPLQYLLEHEPAVVLPYVTFDGIEPLLALSREALGPVLATHLDDPRSAAEVAEWLARLIVSYGLDDTGLHEEERARHLVRTFVLPGLEASTIDLVERIDLLSDPDLTTSDLTTSDLTTPT